MDDGVCGAVDGGDRDSGGGCQVGDCGVDAHVECSLIEEPRHFLKGQFTCQVDDLGGGEWRQNRVDIVAFNLVAPAGDGDAHPSVQNVLYECLPALCAPALVGIAREEVKDCIGAAVRLKHG